MGGAPGGDLNIPKGKRFQSPCRWLPLNGADLLFKVISTFEALQGSKLKRFHFRRCLESCRRMVL